jgi:hypothetical protein
MARLGLRKTRVAPVALWSTPRCKTEVAILAAAHNSLEDQDEWVAAIVNLKSRILREFKKREPPWFGMFSRTANLTTETVKLIRL